MTDIDKLAHRLMALGLPWQTVDVKYALTSGGIEAARFANADRRNAVVDVLNAVPWLIERVATLEADAEVSRDQCNRLIECAHDATARLDSCRQKVTVDGELIESLRRDLQSARSIARVLAHSYEHDSRPPQHMVDEALAFPVSESP
jgi:hypothetical protein